MGMSHLKARNENYTMCLRSNDSLPLGPLALFLNNNATTDNSSLKGCDAVHVKSSWSFESSTICWNIRNYSPVHMASHSRRTESSATSLWKARILQCQYKQMWLGVL